ncbi:(Fe-S)-binding protein [Paenibacillus glucanolyticus]|uniref:(Fe-S)-binding protein n=1 Tax=Paenibacillus glucanolyticus TaxID=59843 RepID=UPI00128DE2BB|nr:(Fe-S)-binding protein [Paenibacillus glucanolyticus]MPY19748.1 (Fe-S)-binding protein [Paenibacillus glucanolyticus]
MNSTHEKLAQSLKLTLDEDQLTNCMRCGFCQTACPTFIETGLEAASPRGRIALMKAVVDGLMEPDESFRSQMDLCLGCRACEPACPSDVKYGQLIEQTRAAIAAEKPYSMPVRIVRKTFLQGVFPHRRRLKLIGKTLSFYQKSGLQKFARNSGAMKLFPDHLQQLEQALPDVSGDGLEELWSKAGFPYRRETTGSGSGLMVIPAAGDTVGRVGMFRGCIMDVMFAPTNVNTVRLLRQAGFEIVIPEEQVCCGALHAHAGEMGDAKQLAGRNIWAFGEANVDYIASNAGGCGALLKEYDHLMHAEPDERLSQAAVRFADQVKDISELLHNLGRPLEPIHAEAGKDDAAVAVTYQDSCHLLNVMRVQEEPRQLMSQLPGVQLCELQGAEVCCGSAGIYNLTQTEMSTTLLDHKMEHVEATGAKVIVTSNPGCLLQMKWGIERAGLQNGVEAVHLADFLAKQVRMEDQLD